MLSWGGLILSYITSNKTFLKDDFVLNITIRDLGKYFNQCLIL